MKRKPEHRKDEYVYKDCKIRMSQKQLSGIMYAAIMCHAGITNTHGIGIYEYERSQNSYNAVDVKIHIHPEYISKFETLSGVKLNNPITVQLNNSSQ